MSVICFPWRDSPPVTRQALLASWRGILCAPLLVPKCHTPGAFPLTFPALHPFTERREVTLGWTMDPNPQPHGPGSFLSTSCIQHADPQRIRLLLSEHDPPPPVGCICLQGALRGWHALLMSPRSIVHRGNTKKKTAMLLKQQQVWVLEVPPWLPGACGPGLALALVCVACHLQHRKDLTCAWIKIVWNISF